jgi:hypothetical protein
MMRFNIGRVLVLNDPPAMALARCTPAVPQPPEAPSTNTASPAVSQGLTHVYFSAQLKRFVWDRGCA